MKNSNGLLLIKNRYPFLTNAEKKCADFILSSPADIPHLTVAEMAARAGVASSAVIRFCKSVGFSSFPELKIHIAVGLSSMEYPYKPHVERDADADDIIDTVFRSGITTLKSTLEMLDRRALKALVQAITQAKRIYLFGIGTSAPLASDAAYRLMQLGYTAAHSSDVVTMRMMAMNMQPGDMAIGISHSGRTVPTVDALRSAKKNGATTACITSFRDSSLYKISDYALTVLSEENDYPVEAISARIAHLCVIDAIAVSLSNLDYDQTTERMKTIQEIMNDLRYQK